LRNLAVISRFQSLKGQKVNSNPQESPRIPKNPQESPAQVSIREVKLREENIREVKSSPNNKYSDDSQEIILSRLLFTKIKARDEKAKEPDYQKWGVHIDRLHRLDSRSFELIEQVITWCQQDDFWQNNILTTAKLRVQFTQLVLRMTKKVEPKSWGALREVQAKYGGEAGNEQ